MITNQYREIRDIQAQVASAQTNLDSQQKKIETVEFLVDSLFSKMTFETILGSDTNRVFIHHEADGNLQAYFVLHSAPIRGSLQATARDQFSTPFTYPIGLIRNIAVQRFGAGWKLDTGTFTFQYVRDTRETNLFQRAGFEEHNLFIDGKPVKQRGNEIFLDGKLIMIQEPP